MDRTLLWQALHELLQRCRAERPVTGPQLAAALGDAQARAKQCRVRAVGDLLRAARSMAAALRAELELVQAVAAAAHVRHARDSF